ncbi:MAG: hypothetical protein M1818_001161 [Claussenomyces sp. TS43310]|nr:MAG: hypothetical protein M1818_001161 [Claussenomyces sp. TS43310]
MASQAEVLLAAIAGVVSHHGVFIYGEWHLRATNVLKCYTLMFLATVGLQLRYRHAQWFQAITLSCQIWTVYAGALFTSITIYRVFFHRLRHFDGPVLARISKLWHVAHCLDSKNYLLLERLHEQYGDVVRTGPDELTIFDPDILPAILDGRDMNKPAWYDNLRPYHGLNTHRSKIVHSHRRRIWDYAFTKEALAEYESQMRVYAHSLRQLVAQNEGKAVAINNYFYWFTFDVMGHFAFSRSFDMLKTGTWHHAVSMLRAGLAIVGPFTPVPWVVRIGSDLPILPQVRDLLAMQKWCARQMDERIERKPAERDISDYLINWSTKHDRLEKDRETLYGDSIAMIIAGSDTAALTLIVLFYFLAKHPEHLKKLQTELEAVDWMNQPDLLQNLPHLNGLINETLRLYPAVPTGGLRETPKEGTILAGRFIPGQTVICAPRYTLGRLESCFEQANEFIPERWYSRPEMVKNKNAFAPFARGQYYCIGKNLAYSELRFVTALLTSEFDVAFPPGDDGSRVVDEYVDQFTATAGPLNLVFSNRRPGA